MTSSAVGLMSAAQIVWRSIGSPPAAGCGVEKDSAACWLCGGTAGSGMPLVDWLPDSFTATSSARCPMSQTVCEACVYLCGRTNPVPGREAKPGKLFGGNWRNYSHFGDADGYASASKGEKPLIREFLLRRKRGPWFCGIADSGQKHVLPLTPLNGSGGICGAVLFEEVRVLWGSEQNDTMRLVGDLLTMGVTKAEVESGAYSGRSWAALEREIRSFESKCARWRGGAVMGLALFLAQREESE